MQHLQTLALLSFWHTREGSRRWEGMRRLNLAVQRPLVLAEFSCQ